MPYFRDADEVYAHIGRLFQDLAANPAVAPELKRADTVVQYRLRRPDAQVTVKLVGGQEPPQVDLGQTALQPEVVMQMDADTAHRLWLGKVNPTVALARGEIRARGPAAKILRLVPLMKTVLPRYRAQLEAAGRDDLVNVA